jgi:hypothetical protein
MKLKQIPDLLAELMAAEIIVEYGYAPAGMNSGSTIMIFHFNDNNKAIRVLGAKVVPLEDTAAIGQLQAAC